MRFAIVAFLCLVVPLVATGGVYDDYNSLTDAEKRLVLRYFWQVSKVRRAAEFARQKSAAIYPSLSGLDDQRDALRHSTWNGCMTTALDSREAAKRWADAHEEIPSNPARRKAMDLANNASGRDLTWARRTVSGPWWNRSVSVPSNDGVAAIMKDAVETGRLVMIEAVNGVRDPHAGRLVPTTRP
jgi:hypothetical protein